MVMATLAVSAAFGIAEGLVFLYVGRELRKREVHGEAATAWRLFVLWWFALGALVLVGGLQALAGAAGYASLAWQLAFTYVAVAGIAVGLWGLVYYLLYLFTGSRKVLAPLTVFYAAVLVGLLWFIRVQDPYDVAVNAWSVQLKYRSTVGGAGNLLVVAGVLLPELLAGVAYGTLFFKVRDPSQRYRIALVSVSIILWFGSSLASNLLRVNTTDAWQVANKLIGLSAALVILAAYKPPTFVRRRGITGVAEAARSEAPTPASPR